MAEQRTLELMPFPALVDDQKANRPLSRKVQFRRRETEVLRNDLDRRLPRVAGHRAHEKQRGKPFATPLRLTSNLQGTSLRWRPFNAHVRMSAHHGRFRAHNPS